MKITWTNCADAMPPDDDTKVIVMDIPTQGTGTVTGHELKDLQDYWGDNAETQWTPYTPEKWKEINK